MVKFDPPSITNIQGLHGVPDAASDITCLKSAAYEIVSQNTVWKNNTYVQCVYFYAKDCISFWLRYEVKF